MGRRNGNLTTIDEKGSFFRENQDMYIRDYFHQIQTLLNRISTISTQNITFDERSEFIGYLKGQIIFVDGSCLYLSEYKDSSYFL